MKKNYYIFKNGRLKREKNTVYFQNEEEKIPIPVGNIGSLNILGQIEVNSRFLEFLAQEGIPTHFYNWHGYYSGSYYPRETLQAGKVLISQAEHYLTEGKRIVLASAFVSASVANIKRNLKYYQRRGCDFEREIETIEKLADGMNGVQDTGELMGIEGKIREQYYRCIAEIIPDAFEFEKRVFRPPNNAINALISFGNSLLYTTTLTAIYRTQLNPTISYLHEPQDRRFSLSLDISEVFKPVIVDRLIFSLVNKKMIQLSDFVEELNSCLLNEGGKKTFVSEYEKRLESTLKHPALNKKTSYEYLVRLECYKLVKHVLGDKQYKGFRMWW